MTRCTECGCLGHAADAHRDPHAAALIWARIVCIQAREAMPAGARQLLGAQAAVWAGQTQLLMRRAR